MSTIYDIAMASGSPASDADQIILPTGVVTVEVEVSGMQGAAGVQNVYVQPTPPLNPQIGWIWIQI